MSRNTVHGALKELIESIYKRLLAISEQKDNVSSIMFEFITTNFDHHYK